MLGSRLFWKLFLGFALVNAITAAALVSATWSWQRDEATTLSQRELVSAAKLLSLPAAAWADEPTEKNADRLRGLLTDTELSVRVTNQAGETLQVGAGDDTPSGPDSVSVLEPLLLASRRVGQLSVCLLSDARDRALSGLWGRYAFYSPFVTLAMVAIGYLLAAHLVGPVQAITRVAASLARSGFQQRVFVSNQDELGDLARHLNQMSESVGRQIANLQESDHRQATVLGGMIEAVIAIDARGHVVFANPAASRVFGFELAKTVGRPLIEAVRNHALYQASTTAVEAAAPQRLEIDWEDHVLSVQVTPLVSDGAAGAVVVLHDTTELRRLENLRRDFVANVSHELKTPLSTIKANAETLLRGAMDDKEHRVKFLRGIDEQSDRLAELIQDMLNLARIESAQQPFAIHNVPISDAVTDCLRDFNGRAEAKRIDLAIDPAGEADDALRVKADREGLRVILSNLIDNAIKYTPVGGAVRVNWRQNGDGPQTMVTLEVIDTGAGIPEEKLARVFERFYRVDEARSRHLGGTGLGLSIVKHLAQAFGGEVSVENTPAGGARFAVTLPAT